MTRSAGRSGTASCAAGHEWPLRTTACSHESSSHPKRTVKSIYEDHTIFFTLARSSRASPQPVDSSNGIAIYVQAATKIDQKNVQSTISLYTCTQSIANSCCCCCCCCCCCSLRLSFACTRCVGPGAAQIDCPCIVVCHNRGRAIPRRANAAFVIRPSDRAAIMRAIMFSHFHAPNDEAPRHSVTLRPITNIAMPPPSHGVYQLPTSYRVPQALFLCEITPRSKFVPPTGRHFT